MIELLILGVGSPFGDDRLGWEVVRLLQQNEGLCHFSPGKLQFAIADRPGMGLLTLMQNAKTVFLIDAVKTGAKQGSVIYLKNEGIKMLNSFCSTHDLGIATALAIGKNLNLLPQNLVLYGIEVRDLAFRFETSEGGRQALQLLLSRIEKDIFTLLGSS